jgi:hypothetical protein
VLPGGEYGFRIHDVSRREEERSASRGRRFAFVAAGAVSLAAIALGGVSAGVPTAGGSPGPGGGSPSNATPLRTPGPAMAADAVRRRSGTQPVARGSGRALPTPVTSVAASAPLLAGMPAPHRSPESGTASALTVTSSGATPFAPLIHLLPAFNEAPVVGALPGGALPGSAMEPVASAIQDTASGGAGAGMR